MKFIHIRIKICYMKINIYNILAQILKNNIGNNNKDIFSYL
jgi:hypothetical protein